MRDSQACVFLREIDKWMMAISEIQFGHLWRIHAEAFTPNKAREGKHLDSPVKRTQDCRKRWSIRPKITALSRSDSLSCCKEDLSC